ncbi:unnamed protein product [Alternaria alternata]
MPSPPATPNLSDYFAADDSFMFPGQRLPTERQPRLSTASNEPTEQDAALLFNADTRSEDSKTKHNMPTFRRRIREGRLKAALKKDEAAHQTGTNDANDARLDQNHGNSPNVSTEISNSSFPSSRPRKRPRYIPSTGALAGQLVPRIESHEDEPIASYPRYSALKSSPDLSQHPTSPRSGMESTSETRQDPISPEFIDVSEGSDTGPAIAPNGTVETREWHIEAWRKSASKSGKLSEKRPHVLMQLRPAPLLTRDWKEVRDLLPQTWKWDVEYHLPHSKLSGGTGSWTCTPLEANEPRMYPLTIAKAPLVLPVEYHWPPSNGVSPPFDPHHGAPIDCSAELSLELVRDIFITFEGIIGFYVLINGLLQVIVPDNFNTKWASSHLPHTFGGLKKAAAGNSKTLKDHDASTWKNLVSRALLYRLHPDFTPPNGHSGTALYADGIREDGTEGPGVVGFQSFVQRSGHVQNFEMEGPALERRLQLGRVAFYGAFEVPAELKKYKIV